jgi:hypothetical protein
MKKLTTKQLVEKILKSTPEEAEALLQEIFNVQEAALIKAVEECEADLNKVADMRVAKVTQERDAALVQVQDLSKKLDAAAANGDVTKITAQRDAALNMVQDLSEQIAAQSKIVDGNKKVVTIDKKKFYLEGQSFIIPGVGEVSAEDLAKDEETLAALLKKGSSILVPAN